MATPSPQGEQPKFQAEKSAVAVNTYMNTYINTHILIYK